MKRPHPPQLLGLLLTLSCSTPALAICEWRGGAGEMVHQLRVGDLYVPRDAPVGTVIGPLEQRYNVTNDGNFSLICNNVNGIEKLSATLPNTAPIFPGPLPPIDSVDLTGRVLQTSVAGVGIHVRLDSPYTGGSQNQWIPSTWTSVPYEGTGNHRTGPAGIEMLNLRVYLTLIKTGPIAPGVHSFNGQELFTGSYHTFKRVMRAHLHGSVSQAQCTLRPDAVSADPVDLGEHDSSEFTGEHYTTRSVPFHITLNDCEDDPSHSTARAYIRFDGVRGSTPIDPDLGLFSLNSSASATGLGIQLLHADSQPVKLQQDLPTVQLSLGDTQVHFQARYYQTQPRVTAGSAEGSLSFTVSYR